MSQPGAGTLQALLGVPVAAPVILTRLELVNWGETVIFGGIAGDIAFELRYLNCRELRWRVYVHESAGVTPLVGFAPGRDQHRSPAQILTAHFGLSLFYGDMVLMPG